MESGAIDVVESEGKWSIPDLHKDLQRKYRNVGSKVEEIWRNWTPNERGKAMREAVGDGKVLRNSRDPSLGHVRGWLPDWNLEDITKTPDFFIDRFKFRAQSDLQIQLYEGANDGLGDRHIMQSDYRVAQRRGLETNKFAMFHKSGTDYARWVGVKDSEAMRAVESVGDRTGLILRAHEAASVLQRQTFTYIFYNHLVEDILQLRSKSRLKKTSTKKPAKDTTDAMAKLSISPKPLKASITAIIVQAAEQKMASEDHLHLLRSEPVVLNATVRTMFYSRPELVPDDRGRILPLLTDIYLSAALFDVMNHAVKTMASWS